MPSKTKSTEGGVRQRLMDTAIRLFGEHGYRATGIDTLLAEAGVAKMSLYTHFRSKDDLIVAMIDELSARLISAFEEVTEGSTNIADQISAIFDAIKDKVESDNFHGCEFIRAISEFPESPSPVHQAVIEHRLRLRGFLESLLVEAKIPNPTETATDLAMLIDGALVDGHATGKPEAAIAGKRIAVSLVTGR